MGNIEIVKFLIDRGVDVNAQTRLGRTPLSKACFLGHTTIVQLLLEQE